MTNFLHRHRYIVRSILVLAAIAVCLWINTQQEWYDAAPIYTKVAAYFGFLVVTILAMNGVIESLIDIMKFRTKKTKRKTAALSAELAAIKAESTHEAA